jgi:hypothetical protein
LKSKKSNSEISSPRQSPHHEEVDPKKTLDVVTRQDAAEVTDSTETVDSVDEVSASRIQNLSDERVAG